MTGDGRMVIVFLRYMRGFFATKEPIIGGLVDQEAARSTWLYTCCRSS